MWGCIWHFLKWQTLTIFKGKKDLCQEWMWWVTCLLMVSYAGTVRALIWFSYLIFWVLIPRIARTWIQELNSWRHSTSLLLQNRQLLYFVSLMTISSHPTFGTFMNLRDREVACSDSDHRASNFESCVWRAVSFHSSNHPQGVLLDQLQLSLHVHKGVLKPHSFHFIFQNLFNQPL